MYRLWTISLLIVVGAASGLASLTELQAGTHPSTGGAELDVDPPGRGLFMPRFNAARGRMLFASKGCVVCHSANGVGGTDAIPLDVSTMGLLMNPFEFSARMWRGAEAMIFLQREELGEQIEFTGGEIADIIAFAHDPQEQRRFTEADIPPRIRDLMEHIESEDEDEHGDDEERENRK